MARMATDVVLLPDEAMTNRAIEINKQIREKRWGKPRPTAAIVLNREDCLPHISLAMGCIEQQDVDAIGSVLEQLAEETPVRQLTATGILSGNGQKAAVLEIERTEELQRLHEQVLDEMRPFFSHEVTDAMFHDDIVAQTTLDWVRDYPQKASYEDFSPHITLGYGQAKPTFSFPMAFAVVRLALCRLGNHCTCRKVLAAADVAWTSSP